jgi:transketolase N-terminal domain/subunit
MSELHDRIIEISKKHHLAHLGSTLTAVNIIDEIYKTKQHDEKFILSAGHMGLALFVVIEKYEGVDAESIFLHHGVHPDRCEKCHLYCSTGSLGNGLPIALGMAMADRTKNVYCLISDGEAFEGTIWETANVMRRYSVTNLKVYLNYNSYSAYDIVDKWMIDNLKTIMPIEVRRTDVEDYGLEGLSAHYITL